MNELIIDLTTGESRIEAMTNEQIAGLEAIRAEEMTWAQQIEQKLSRQSNTQIMVEALWDEFRPFLASILAGTPQSLTFGDMMAKVAQRYLAEGGEI
jgi:hypothetical protein